MYKFDIDGEKIESDDLEICLNKIENLLRDKYDILSNNDLRADIRKAILAVPFSDSKVRILNMEITFEQENNIEKVGIPLKHKIPDKILALRPKDGRNGKTETVRKKIQLL